MTGGGLNTTGANVGNKVIGWNYEQIRYCEGFYSGSAFYLYVYPSQGGCWYTTDPNFQHVLEPECAAGHWVAFYVYNSAGNWNYLYTYYY